MITARIDAPLSVGYSYQGLQQEFAEKLRGTTRESERGRALVMLLDEMQQVQRTTLQFTLDQALTLVKARIMELQQQQPSAVFEEFLRITMKAYPPKKDPQDVLNAVMKRIFFDKNIAPFEAFILGVVAEKLSADIRYVEVKKDVTLDDIRRFCLQRMDLTETSTRMSFYQKQQTMDALIYILNAFYA